MVKENNRKVSSLVEAGALNQRTNTRSYISPITRRILAINILALVLLVVGLLYVGQYRKGLIDNEISALNIQAELFAAAIGEAAVGNNDSNQTLVVKDAQQILRRMVNTTGITAQLFLPNGKLLIDSRLFRGPSGNVEVRELPPPRIEITIKDKVNNLFRNILRELLPDIKAVSDLSTAKKIALKGEQGSAIRTLAHGKFSLSVAVPVQRYKKVLAALILTNDGSKINETIFQVRLDILKIFSLVLLVTILLSIYLASSIARPLKNLAIATEDIRKGKSRHYAIDDILSRKDEIGELGNMLNDMTEALWRRMETIERFAADVAHEIKNPLTSIKSAVETIASIKNSEQQMKLMEIVKDDIGRLDRLISDISDASRLDAELSRKKMVPIKINLLLEELISFYGVAVDTKGIQFKFNNEFDGPILIQGNEDRIVQVFRNLIDNAISFSPEKGIISLRLNLDNQMVKICVEDEGVGLQPGTEESVFKRFYRERPDNEKFGMHSGLGLSISQQIIKAHGGMISAKNLRDDFGKILGACFIIELPKAE
ncbi:MAG: stimulus-sensing domain-containing protein [Pseudomonadota bacterium]|nr:stimulus-sensing domain-containing protein [Pseudomonadota bacterium]